MKSSVSVIIPAYNAAYCLGRCISSVRAQTQPPLETIVINDGSTDTTAEVAKGFGDGIVYLEQENRGQGVARNAGLAVAQGKYVAFLDADDYWQPDFVSACVDFLGRHPDAVAVNTAYAIRKRGKTRVGPPGLLAGANDQTGYLLDNFFDTWAAHDHVRTGTVMIRREVIEQAGYQLDIRISQDLEYWANIATYGRWGFIPAPLWGADSARTGGPGGWLAKYRRRRTLCPDVAEWQARIVSRLSDDDWAGFRCVRGRVAKNFAHGKILAQDRDGARLIVERWVEDFPKDHIARVMSRSVRSSAVRWRMCCRYLVLRELCKNGLLMLASKARP